MNSLPIQEKTNECKRMIDNISRFLPVKLAPMLHLEGLQNHDFVHLMRLIRDNFTAVQPQLHGPLNREDIRICMDIRHKVSHQVNTTIGYLNNALNSLRRCQKAFQIQSALVQLRVMACKTCGQVITRTAQPPSTFTDTEGEKQRVTRTYDVQSWVVGNAPLENASRENTWYPGWIWTRTFCSQCHTHIGFRFDWAPEDRVDLTQVNVRYNLNPHQAMIVTYPDGTVKDLTHVVSDGEVRRHRYGLYFNKLRAIPANP
jgi:hypothetical protein